VLHVSPCEGGISLQSQGADSGRNGGAGGGAGVGGRAYPVGSQVSILESMLQNFFPSLLTMRPNKQECLYLAITFQSGLTFAGNTRSFPKKEPSERCSNRVGSGLALKF
jgi:hypothetical protein